MSMTALDQPREFSIEARDVSGQKVARVSRLAGDSTVGEVIDLLANGMSLPRNGSDGLPIRYQVLLEREGRHLNSGERVQDALREDDRVVLQPNIEAAGRRQTAE